MERRDAELASARKKMKSLAKEIKRVESQKAKLSAAADLHGAQPSSPRGAARGAAASLTPRGPSRPFS